MTTRTRIWLAGGVIGLALLLGAKPGWAACCKCAPCVDGGVACFALATQGECTGRCPIAGSGVCAFDSFSADATCGLGEFADCTFIDGREVEVRAPVMGMPAMAVTAIVLMMAGSALLARRHRRDG